MIPVSQSPISLTEILVTPNTSLFKSKSACTTFQHFSRLSISISGIKKVNLIELANIFKRSEIEMSTHLNFSLPHLVDKRCNKC